jgi:UDP-glucose 4-epimerase
MSKNVLVVGGAGFIGRKLTRRLNNLGFAVNIFDDESIIPAEEPSGYREYFRSSIMFLEDLMVAIRETTPSIIYWLVSRQGYLEDWHEYGSTNVAGAYNFFSVLNRLGKTFHPNRIVLSSSQAIYLAGLRRKEKDPKIPPSVYGITKLQQEQAFHHFADTLSVEVVALRYSVVLGDGQSMQASESGILRNWYREVRQGKPPTIYGDGEQIRDFVHVDDVVEANVLAGTSELGRSRAYNVAGFPQKIAQLAAAFQEVSGCADPVALGKDVRPGGEYGLTSDHSLIWGELGWAPKKSIQAQVGDFWSFTTKKEAEEE